MDSSIYNYRLFTTSLLLLDQRTGMSSQEGGGDEETFVTFH